MRRADNVISRTAKIETHSESRDHSFFESRYWLRDLILSVLLAFIVVVFLYQPVQVEGNSMMPRLVNRERLFINKFVYRFEPIRRVPTRSEPRPVRNAANVSRPSVP